MKIRRWENGEKYVSHCSWRLSEGCEDKNTTKEDIKEFAIKHNIDKVSSGICRSCAAILNAELDEKENN